jgi:hypothetical protein
MNAPDLETRLRSYYQTCPPKDSARLMLASRTVLDEARRSRPRLALWGGLKVAATLAVARNLRPRRGIEGGGRPGGVDAFWWHLGRRGLVPAHLH